MTSASGDADLVRECLHGNLEAFDALVERYQRPIFNVALRMVNNYDDANDIAQTVFLKAYENLSSFNPRYKFHSWVYRIAINESLNHASRARPTEPLDAAFPRLASEAKDPEETLALTERDRSVRDALMSFPPAHRAVIVLRHYLGCSYDEIGRILNIPEKRVKSRLYTARQQLKDALVKRGIEWCA